MKEVGLSNRVILAFLKELVDSKIGTLRARSSICGES